MSDHYSGYGRRSSVSSRDIFAVVSVKGMLWHVDTSISRYRSVPVERPDMRGREKVEIIQSKSSWQEPSGLPHVDLDVVICFFACSTSFANLLLQWLIVICHRPTAGITYTQYQRVWKFEVVSQAGWIPYKIRQYLNDHPFSS